MVSNQTTDVLDFDELEKSFNASISELRKSLGAEAEPEDTDEQLEKAGKESSKAMDYDDEAEEAEESDDEDEEDEEEEDEAEE